MLGHLQTRGRLTVPANLRKRLGLNSGDVVVFEETPRGLLLTPATMRGWDAWCWLGPEAVDEEAAELDCLERLEASDSLDLRRAGDALLTRLRDGAGAPQLEYQVAELIK